MAESVDALVSNTSGATRAGSTPALGTEKEKDFCLSPFSFFIYLSQIDCEGTLKNKAFLTFLR